MNDLKSDGSSRRSYVSCMKLNGVPLLPPLMTPECRQEMQYYRQLAVAVERRISDLRFCLDETTINSNILHSDSEEWCDGINISIVSSKNDDNNESCSDCPKYDCLNSNCYIQANYAENNEFESMNSQLTVIDNDEQFSESKLNSVSENKLNKNSSNEATKVLITENVSVVCKDTSHLNTTIDLNSSADHNSNLNTSIQKQSLKDLSTSKDPKFNINLDQLKHAKNLITNVESTKSVNIHENSKSSTSSSKINVILSSTKLKKNNSKKDILTVPKKLPSVDTKSKALKNADMLNIKKVQKKTVGIDSKSKLSPSKNVTGSLNNISSGLSSPPKLVRQNSYTLEYPSPLLLAHLEVQSLASGVELQSISMSDSTSTSHLPNAKQKHVDSNTAKEVWSSLGSDINSLSLNDSSTIETINDVSAVKEISTNVKYDESKSNEMIPKNVESQKSTNMSSIDSKQNKTSEIISHDGIKNHLTNISDDEFSQNTISLETSSKWENLNNSSLKYILKKFEEEHAKKLADLVKKQKEEQILLRKSFESQQKLLLAQFQNVRQKEDQEVSNKAVKSNEMENNKYNSEKNEVSQIISEINPASVNLVNAISFKSLPQNTNEMKIVENKKKSDISNKEKYSDCTKNKDFLCDMYDNIVSSRSGNTLDDINVTFASDDSGNIYDNKNNETPYYSNVTVREIDGMSKLKSAFDKITRIQQNLASQPSFKYTEPIPDKVFHNDDFLSNKSQSVSLSSIGTISQLYSEPEIHYPVMDRNALSLNLVDISRPQSSHQKNYVKHQRITEKEIRAATTIVAYAKGYLTRRLMRTEKVESIVQTIRDTLLCALQLYKDEKGIQGPDVDLHRRLIQQITAACYALHDMFIISTPAERMSVISQDRERKISLSYRSSSTTPTARQLSATTQKILKRKLEGMSKSHSGVFTNRSVGRPLASNQMTRSHYGSIDHNDHSKVVLGYRPRRTISVSGEHGGNRKPWR